MSASVFIDGGEGTTGLEIRERLAGRDAFTLARLADDKRKDIAARREVMNDADFVILCLPDDAAREAVALIDNPRTRVIDASSAHRVADGWTYGLAELEPDRANAIAAAKRVSNPGCWPTGFLLLVRPLVRAGLVPHGWPLSYSGASGYSGGGRTMIGAFEAARPLPEDDTAFRAYGLTLAHKHLPEMQKHARIEHAPIFQPAVARAYRGMLGEVPLPLHALPRKPSLAAIATCLREAYATSTIVDLVAPDGLTSIGIERDAASDHVSLTVFGNPATGQARLIATYDNLGKGAAGAAVQNLNLMAGRPIDEGLAL